jgi:hypothetical protein
MTVTEDMREKLEGAVLVEERATERRMESRREGWGEFGRIGIRYQARK